MEEKVKKERLERDIDERVQKRRGGGGGGGNVEAKMT